MGRATIVLKHELVVQAAEARLQDYELTSARGEPRPLADHPIIDADAPPRARLADALLLARQAAAGQGLGEAGLAQAVEAASAAVAARPHWGEAWAVKAYVEVVRGGAGSGAAVAALTRSYMDAPFLDSAAKWRVRYGLMIWDKLDADVRHHVLAEGLWLSRRDGESRAAFFDAARGTSAYRPLMLGWRTLRREEQISQRVGATP